jgi:uncharacterized RDD family membrane protein YckC
MSQDRTSAIGTRQLSPYAPPSAEVDRDGMDADTSPATYAGFWVRFCAAFLDGLLTTLLFFVVGAVVGVATMLLPAESRALLSNLTVLVGIVGAWLYYALQESSDARATLGKRAFKLQVATQDDRARISFARATGRYFAHFLSLVTLYVGYLMQPFTARKQALHDLVSGTVVVTTGAASTAWVAVIIVLVLLVPLTGMVAAIALPAYQDYTIRAQVGEGLLLADAVRTADAEYYASESKFAPDMAALRYPGPVSSRFVSAVTVRDGGIDVEYGNQAHSKLSGKHMGIQMLVDESGSFAFVCGSGAVPPNFQPIVASERPVTDVPTRYLPATCRPPR